MEGYNLPRSIYFLSKHCFISLFLTILLGTASDAEAKMRNFETARMKSTAGAGVGSLLLDEGTLLNPASMGFYTISSIYFQSGGMDITPTDTNSPYIGKEPSLKAFIGSDASRGTGGSISFTEQVENFDTRERLSLALGAPVSEKVAIGVSFRKTTDTYSLTNNGQNFVEDDYNQFTFGITQVMSPQFSMGFVVVDPFQTKPEDTLAVLGFQYVYKSITFILDLGANYNDDLSKSSVYRGAIQVNVFNDFFVRFGTYKDQGKGESGNGVGAGWAGPKLVLDLALKNTTIDNNILLNRAGEKIRETSFSLSYKF